MQALNTTLGLQRDQKSVNFYQNLLVLPHEIIKYQNSGVSEVRARVSHFENAI